MAAGSPEALYGLRPTSSPRTLSFDDALKIAAEKNWDLRAVAERVEQQSASLRRAWAAVLPKLSVGGNYTFSYPDEKVAFGSEEANKQQALLFSSLGGIVAQQAANNPDPAQAAQQQAQAQALLAAADKIGNSEVPSIEIQPTHVVDGAVTLVVPLFNGRAIPAIMNATQAVDLARASQDQARAGVVLAVTRAYYGAWTAQRFVSIAEEQLTATQAHEALTQKQSDSGLITPLALERTQLDVVRAEQSLRAAQQGATQARAGLGLLLGVVDDFAIAAPPAVPAVEAGTDTDALIARAKAARSDLAVQKMALDIARRGIMDAWMQYLPILSLQAQGRYTSNTGGLIQDPLTSSVVVNATIPLYDGGNRYASMRESDSRVREEEDKLEQLEARIESQVRGNREDIRVRDEALAAARRAVELARAARDNAAKYYELGAATNLDVVDANLGVFSAELDLARAELDLAQGRLGLAYILGELRPQAGNT